MTRKYFHVPAAILFLPLLLGTHVAAAPKGNASLTPIRKVTARGGYSLETIGDTLHQASPQNARLIIRVSGSDKKLIKPDGIALIDKSGKAIAPVFREDRKVGHEENTGLPLSVSPQADSYGRRNVGVGVNLNKVFGPKGDYAYTKVDWPKQIFTADKRLQIVVRGQSLLIPLTSVAK